MFPSNLLRGFASPNRYSSTMNSTSAPSSGVLIKLADIFHVSTDYLLGIEQRKMIDVSGLNEADIKLMLITVKSLRENIGNEQQK